MLKLFKLILIYQKQSFNIKEIIVFKNIFISQYNGVSIKLSAMAQFLKNYF